VSHLPMDGRRVRVCMFERSGGQTQCVYSAVTVENGAHKRGFKFQTLHVALQQCGAVGSMSRSYATVGPTVVSRSILSRTQKFTFDVNFFFDRLIMPADRHVGVSIL